MATIEARHVYRFGGGAANGEAGNKELDKGIRSARNARKLKWWALGIFVLICIVIGLAVGLYFGFNNRSNNNNN